MFHFFIKNLESFALFNKSNFFFNVPLLYYSVTINESKERSRIVFCCFSVIKNIAAQSSSSNFPVKLLCWGILVLACLDKSIPNFDDMKI